MMYLQFHEVCSLFCVRVTKIMTVFLWCLRKFSTDWVSSFCVNFSSFAKGGDAVVYLNCFAMYVVHPVLLLVISGCLRHHQIWRPLFWPVFKFNLFVVFIQVNYCRKYFFFFFFWRTSINVMCISNLLFGVSLPITV